MQIKIFLDKLNEMLGEDLDAEIFLVSQIERHRSGKRRSVISKISEEYLW